MIIGYPIKLRYSLDGDSLPDPYGARGELDQVMEVSNVLVAPKTSQDGTVETMREWDLARLVLHFPKVAITDQLLKVLPGSLIEIQVPGWRGVSYRVVGEPRPYMVENTPTPWAMPVEVERVIESEQ